MKTTGASEGAGGLLEGDKDQALTHGSWTKKKKKKTASPFKGGSVRFILEVGRGLDKRWRPQ